MGVGVLGQTGATFAEFLPGKRAIIIADENTWGAAGPGVQASLQAARIDLDESIIYPGKPVFFAYDAAVLRLRDRLA